MDHSVQKVTCQVVQSEQDLKSCLELRKLIFVQEQGVREDREQDEYDRVDPTVESLGRRWKVKHFIAWLGTQVVATGRARRTSMFGIKLERIAVRKEERRKHIGETLLQFMLREIQEEDAAIYLHSQTPVVRFYESLGFSTLGQEFYEEGIPHYKMVFFRLPLPSLHAHLMHHVSLRTSNIEHSVTFYSLFGFREVKNYSLNRYRSVLIESALLGSRLELIESVETQSNRGSSHESVEKDSFQISFDITWQCTSLQDFLDGIVSKAESQYEGQLNFLKTPYHERLGGFMVEAACFKDPEGFIMKVFRRVDIC
ncbi:hypothetical protein GAYE_SCF19G3923 [Galdieria yellowstonensis]|uniref:N-acetyltransferase domain-containing protein n=1 Tax=Galdieria yellowstonensis TaxID=3028027 RepID=A0AAV9IF20_9RHOD|nr:hypothetical protein GAYE_SCF19G3923 [Galdieria yellowstonensis]